MMDCVLADLRQTLQAADRESCYFLCQKISRMMERNRFGLFWTREDELTRLGEVLAGIFEAVLVCGVWKLRRDEDDGVS